MKRGVLVLTLAALLLSSACVSVPQSQAASSGSAFGVNAHVASRYPDFDSLERPANLVAELGNGWAREDVQWHRIQPAPDRWDWSWYDRVFASYNRNGVNIIGVIGPAVGWATPNPNDGSSEVSFFAPDPDRYAAFARAVAEHYRGRVAAWEIWNEPENGVHWQPAPDPAAYAQLLTKAYAAIKSVDPGVTVLSGGVVPFDPSFLTALAANGGWKSFDALAVHPYVDPYTPETAQIDVVGIQNVRTLAARYGDKPIWVTEFGWGTGPCERDMQGRTNEEQQANYLVRGAVMLRGAGAERVLWYNYKDRSQPCYGLVRADGGDSSYGSLKPAAIALKTLNAQVGGARPLGAQHVMPSQIVLSFDDASGWGRPYPPDKPAITASSAQVHSGSASGQITYQWTSGGNDYVAFPRSVATPLPANTTKLGLWVYGDGSGHILQVRIQDGQGEVLQYRLGFLGTAGWQFLSTSLMGEVEQGNRITGGNGRLDGNVQLKELVIDDHPDTATGSGTFWIDDLTAYMGGEVFDQRFDLGGGNAVDVVWSPTGASISLPTVGSSAQVTDRNGASQLVAASNGGINLQVGPSPLFVRYTPGQASAPEPAPQQPAPQPQPNPAPNPAPTRPREAGENSPPAANGQYANEQFRGVWQRTDRPIAEGQLTQPRSWLWGPQPITAAHSEPYADSPGGQRQVQYFDKSRMELNDPASRQVTNGLLVVEMLSGQIQIGDSQFRQGTPAEQAVAGDPTEVNPNGPTYASFRSVAFPVNTTKAPNRRGQRVTSVLARSGSVSDDPSLAGYNVTLESYDDTLGHNVPQVFTDFFVQRGLVYENGYRDGQVFDAIFAVGLPLSEPYWARVKVGGVEKDVLMQAFQRRVLTYTPDNPDGFKVEMGNVGQHYLRWRYGP